MTPISSLAETTGTLQRAGDPLGRAVAGAGLAGRHRRVGHEVDVGPGDAAAVGRDDDGAVHLGQLGQPLRAVRGVDEEAARADGQHSGPSSTHEQGARPWPARPGRCRRAAACPVRPWPARRASRRWRRGTGWPSVDPREAARPSGRRRSTRPSDADGGQRLGHACCTRDERRCRRTAGDDAGTMARRNPMRRRLGEAPPGVGDLADLAAEADLADHDHAGGRSAGR